MKTPEMMIGFKSLDVGGTEYEEYCDLVKKAVERITTKRGVKSMCSNMWGTEHNYVDSRFKLRYIDSDLNHYYVEVNRNYWDKLPLGKNSMFYFLVNEGGKWNLVFHLCEDCGSKTLFAHIPGSWYEELQKL